MRANYPETYAYIKAKRARHPREDAIEDYTQWTVRLARRAGVPGPLLPRPLDFAVVAAPTFFLQIAYRPFGGCVCM